MMLMIAFAFGVFLAGMEALSRAIDIALTRAAELNAAMPRARTEARLPAMIGQSAFDRAAEAFSALVEARRRIVATHESLDEARLQIGLKEVASGDLNPKVPPGFTEAAAAEAPVAQLRAVA